MQSEHLEKKQVIFFKKLEFSTFCSKCSECVNMHQNAPKCVQNEMCKCFMHEIIKEVVFITYRLVKLTIFHAKIGYFVPSAQNASICIRMHQNVCRMKCANVLCTKISKNGFILHLKGLKSAKYLLHFVMEDPVCLAKKFFDPCSLQNSQLMHLWICTINWSMLELQKLQ